MISVSVLSIVHRAAGRGAAYKSRFKEKHKLVA